MTDNTVTSAEQTNPATRWPDNWIDREFRKLMDFIAARDQNQVREAVIANLARFERNDRGNYQATVDYYNKYKLWGEYHPEAGNYELIDNRTYELWKHRPDFEWLYGRLQDYRSKKVLVNILSYWLSWEYSYITDLVDHYYHQYFDYDIIGFGTDEVVVDLGAYIGDTMVDYVNMVGAESFQRYYCYEIVPESLFYIEKNIERFGLKNVVIRAKGASDKSGLLRIACENAPSTSRLAESGGLEVPTVAIDDDIDEPVTFIKMDVEGGEEQALNGCRRKILESHPKLALAAYHNHKDLWKLARIVDGMDPDYRFYLRYYGMSLLPTEYVLYAL